MGVDLRAAWSRAKEMFSLTPTIQTASTAYEFLRLVTGDQRWQKNWPNGAKIIVPHDDPSVQAIVAMAMEAGLSDGESFDEENEYRRIYQAPVVEGKHSVLECLVMKIEKEDPDSGFFASFFGHDEGMTTLYIRMDMTDLGSIRAEAAGWKKSYREGLKHNREGLKHSGQVGEAESRLAKVNHEP